MGLIHNPFLGKHWAIITLASFNPSTIHTILCRIIDNLAIITIYGENWLILNYILCQTCSHIFWILLWVFLNRNIFSLLFLSWRILVYLLKII